MYWGERAGAAPWAEGRTVTVANWRADDMQPAIRGELMIPGSRGSRSSEIAWRREGGRNKLQIG